MIDAKKIEMVRARSTEPGAFIKIGSRDSLFLRCVQRMDVEGDTIEWLLRLNGERAFGMQYLDTAQGDSVLIIPDVKLEVDYTSGVSINSLYDRIGWAFRDELSAGFVSPFEGDGAHNRIIDLEGEIRSLSGDKHAFAFSRWQLVCDAMAEEHRVILKYDANPISHD